MRIVEGEKWTKMDGVSGSLSRARPRFGWGTRESERSKARGKREASTGYRAGHASAHSGSSSGISSSQKGTHSVSVDSRSIAGGVAGAMSSELQRLAAGCSGVSLGRHLGSGWRGGGTGATPCLGNACSVHKSPVQVVVAAICSGNVPEPRR